MSDDLTITSLTLHPDDYEALRVQVQTVVDHTLPSPGLAIHQDHTGTLGCGRALARMSNGTLALLDLTTGTALTLGKPPRGVVWDRGRP